MPTVTSSFDLTNQVFGHWTVLTLDGEAGSRRRKWICRCVCGTVKAVRQSGLRDGTSRSCGCVHLLHTRERMMTNNPRFKHGQARAGAHTKEYWIWAQMRKRCSDPKQRYYKDYGGRGITVCDRWQNSFADFIADMGPRPSDKHSIDRIDNDGNYEPGNCRWATPSEQANNTKRITFIEFNGERKPVGQWAKILGVNSGLILYRIRAGWSIENALFMKAHGMPR